MMLAGLLAWAFVTYHPSDDAIADGLPLWEALWSPQKHQAVYRIQNGLGLTGAALARTFVREWVGYNALLPLALVFAWGGAVFRQRMTLAIIRRLVRGSGWTLGLMAWLSLCMGWLGHATASPAAFRPWAGAWGLGIAGALHTLLGTVGSLLVLLVALAGAGMAAFDVDVRPLWKFIQQLISAGAAVPQQILRRLRPSASSNDADRLLPKRPAALPPSGTDSSPDPPSTDAPMTNTTDDRSSPGSKAPPPGRLSPPLANSGVPDVDPSDPPVEQTDAAPPDPSASTTEDPLADVPSDIVDDVLSDAPSAGSSVDDDNADLPPPSSDNPSPAPPSSPPPFDAPLPPPSKDLLIAAPSPTEASQEILEHQNRLLDTLAMYNISIADVNAVVGPSVTRYDLTPGTHTSIQHIKALEDDLAFHLSRRGFRMVAPLPTDPPRVGVELPNPTRSPVRLRALLDADSITLSDHSLPAVLGRGLGQAPYIVDLASLPHLLMAGRSDTERRTGLHALLLGVLFACAPQTARFVLLNANTAPLQPYETLHEHSLALPSDPANGIASCIDEMHARRALLKAADVPDRMAYNRALRRGLLPPSNGDRLLPALIVVIPHLARSLREDHLSHDALVHLARQGAQVGIHLVVSTGRLTADTISDSLKNAIPHRIAYATASRADSRRILNQRGAERLLGNGDLLYRSPDGLHRVQGPAVEPEEVRRVVNAIAAHDPPGTYPLPCLDASHPLRTDV